MYRNVLIDTGQRDRLAALEAHINRRGTIDSVGSLLQGAGFLVVDIDSTSFRMRFADGSALLRHHFIRLGFVHGWKSIPDVDSVQKTFERLERELNVVAERRGELALTIPMACFVARRQSTGHLDSEGAS